MKKSILTTSLVISFVFILSFFYACEKEPDEVEITSANNSILDLNIPDNFDFKTSKEVEALIYNLNSKSGKEAKFKVFLYGSQGHDFQSYAKGDDGEMVSQSGALIDVLKNLSFVKVTDDPVFKINLVVPNDCDSVLVFKNDLGQYSTQVVHLDGCLVSASFTNGQTIQNGHGRKDDLTDMLVAVNNLKEVFSINPLTGDSEIIATMPSSSGGSWTCAIDPVTQILYTVGINAPYELYAYDMNNETWDIRGSVNYQGSRLGYNVKDGMLYYSFDNYILLINPDDGNILSYYVVDGLHNTSGGDLVFAENGTMYLSSSSGLYKCTITGGNNIQASRISTDNLPNYPNALTFGQNQNLWFASNVDNQSRIYVMDTITGEWEDRYTLPNNTIHDLTTSPVNNFQIQEVDADGDGVIDFYDDYPNDAERANNTYNPSICEWGTYAFEEMWPSQGDYDFNDLVINYKYTNVINAGDLVVETIMNFKIKNDGGSYKNGFGIQIDINPDLIQQVSGYNHTDGIVTLNGNGLEAGQNKAVVIVFDNARANTLNSEFLVKIEYTSPVQQKNVSAFNPFIFVNAERGREVHLSGMEPTSLVQEAYFGTSDDRSDPAAGRYYKNSTNLPWAIDIIYDFVCPKEKTAINLGYTKFGDWAQSGGQDYKDWYKELNGYRNDAFLSE